MRRKISAPPPYARRKVTRFLFLPLTLRDHPSPTMCSYIQRWGEVATWEEQLNDDLCWEKRRWLDLRDDLPDVSDEYWEED